MVPKQSASRAKQSNAKKSPAKQPQQKKTTAKKHPFIAALVKVILIGLLIIIIPWVGIPLTLSVIFNITEQSQSKGVQEQMVQSLQERYHEEFIVEKPKLKGASIDTRGVWEATAYPTKNKEYAITVEKGDSEDSKPYDNYITIVWSKAATRQIQPMIQNHSVGAVHVRATPDDKAYSTAQPTPDSYLDFYNNRPQDLKYYIYISYDGEQKDMRAVAEEAFHLVALARERGVKDDALQVDYTETHGDGEKWGRYCSEEDLLSLNNIHACLSHKVRDTR